MRTAKIIYHNDPDGWWAISPDVPGYSGFGATYEEVREQMREGLPWFAEEADLVLVHIVPPSEAGKSEGANVTFETTQQSRTRFSASPLAALTTTRD